MSRFIKILEDQYNDYKLCENKSHFLSSVIFDLRTYDDDIDNMFCNIMIDVIKCIVNRTNLSYQQDNYVAYLSIVNTHFLSDKLEWGTSIRTAWFDEYKEYDVNGIIIKRNEINTFMIDLIKWFEC